MASSEKDPAADNSEDSIGQLIAQARSGNQDALGRLINECREYLLLVANQDLDRDVRQKVGPSDVVQESLVAAQQNFEQFRGETKQDLRAWIRGILVNDLRDTRRHYKQSQKRNVEQERSLDSVRPENSDPIDGLYTPGTQAVKNEEAKLLEHAMAQLPQEYQQVLRLRHWQQMQFSEIGKEMNRSAEAARKLWSRAVEQLNELLAE